MLYNLYNISSIRTHLHLNLHEYSGLIAASYSIMNDTAFSLHFSLKHCPHTFPTPYCRWLQLLTLNPLTYTRTAHARTTCHLSQLFTSRVNGNTLQFNKYQSRNVN